MVGGFFIAFICFTMVNSAIDCPKRCTCLGNYVDCSYKELVSVPSDIPTWTTQLNLNNNQIFSITGMPFDGLDQLTDLRLNKNKIDSIPKEVFESLKRLKILEMNRNKLEEIEALTFKSLEQLTVLKLKRNSISQLRDGAFFGLTKIKSLFLEDNLIQIISKSWLYGLDNLKELRISNNVIEHVEADSWEFCQALIHLNLANNLIKSIKRDTFKYLTNLQKLVLNNNYISFIEDNAFEHLPNLRILQLTNNQISWAIEDANGVFSNLINLQKFYIASNGIKSVNKNAFKGLSKVVYLDVGENNITSIQNNAFIEMPLLEDLLLNTTALLCDCNIKWFYDWYNTNKKYNLNIVCSYPEWFTGVSLLSIPLNNFTCVPDELPNPRLIEQPEPEIMALKGENISLTCKAMSSAPGPMSFIWKKDNIEILNGNISVFATTTLDGKNTESTSVLHIPNVLHSDAGKYQCVAFNTFGSTYSQKSGISVLIFPTFIKIPTDVTIKAGTTARLECAANGEPLPEIAWQKDGGNDFPAARERRMHVMPTDDVFFIINAKPSDTGVYSCTANNAAGTIVANVTLTIEEQPSFVKPMENKEITAGESVVLQCMASGAPKPTIQWFKDGAPIKPTERHFLTAEDQLMIIVDTVVSDAGSYGCHLSNSLGMEIGCSELLVKPGVTNDNELMGIIIITVVCCAVLTSVVWVVIIYQTRKRMNHSKILAQLDTTALDFTDKGLVQFPDNTSEHSSCKDSGTGDSAKRSNDDLVPGEEYKLIINDNNEEGTCGRPASLIYTSIDGTTSYTPLLDQVIYPCLTNHDRLVDSQDTSLDIHLECVATESINKD